MCIELKAYIKLQDTDKILGAYNQATVLIEYVYGVYHPLHSTFSSFLGNYFLELRNFEKALEYYEKSLNDALRILGVDHVLTSAIYIDIAKLYKEMGSLEKSRIFLEKAYAIYETKKHVNTLPILT